MLQAMSRNYKFYNFPLAHFMSFATVNWVDQRLEYLQLNPVAAGFVEKPEDWMYSSARQYAGMCGLFGLELIE